MLDPERCDHRALLVHKFARRLYSHVTRVVHLECDRIFHPGHQIAALGIEVHQHLVAWGQRDILGVSVNLDEDKRLLGLLALERELRLTVAAVTGSHKSIPVQIIEPTELTGLAR